MENQVHKLCLIVMKPNFNLNIISYRYRLSESTVILSPSLKVFWDVPTIYFTETIHLTLKIIFPKIMARNSYVTRRRN